MNKKGKLTKKDFAPLADPVWIKTESGLEPSPFFLQWWVDVSMQRYGDKEHLVEVAVELGYIWRYRDQYTGKICYDPIGFDYDPAKYRASLKIPKGMPIIRQDESRQTEYQQLWKSLLSEDKE